MPLPRPKSFVTAFLAQKIAELLVLALLMAVAVFIVARSAESYPIAIPGEPLPDVGRSIFLGFQTSTLFFAFSAYPLITFVLVWAYRKFLRGRALPFFSALVSFGFVMCWAIPTGAISATWFWAVTAAMVAFIVGSSAALYPRAAAATKTAQGA